MGQGNPLVLMLPTLAMADCSHARCSHTVRRDTVSDSSPNGSVRRNIDQ